MYRTHNCGELKMENVGDKVTSAGSKSRDLGGLTFIDLRDRFGITQLVFNMDTNAPLCLEARKLGREDVVRVKGNVSERSNKNKNISTGDIEIEVLSLEVLNKAETPPFTIENETDGGEELRMKYRFLDLRRAPIRDNIVLGTKWRRHVALI